MTFEEQLQQYRKAYGLQREDMKAPVDEEPQKPELVWAEDIEVPVPQDPMASPVMTGDIEMPQEVLKSKDDRVSDNEEDNKFNFMEYMNADPVAQQHLPQMEALLNEVVSQMLDPENPMSKEEAERVFVRAMEENFRKYFE